MMTEQLIASSDFYLGQQKRVMRRTKKQLERILVNSMRAILGSGVTLSALKFPSQLGMADLDANQTLCERLSNAHGALAALNGYGQPDGIFVLDEENQEHPD